MRVSHTVRRASLVGQRQCSASIRVYPSALTDAEGGVLAALLPPAKAGGRPRAVKLRRVINGLFSLVRAECAWRYATCRATTARGPGSITSTISACGEPTARGNEGMPDCMPDGEHWRASGQGESRRRVPRSSRVQSVKPQQGGPRGCDGGKQVLRTQTACAGRYAGPAAQGGGPSG
jgi:hypothetical protein